MMMMIMAVVVTDDHGSFSLKVYDLYCVEQQFMTVFSGNLTQLKDQFRVQVFIMMRIAKDDDDYK